MHSQSYVQVSSDPKSYIGGVRSRPSEQCEIGIPFSLLWCVLWAICLDHQFTENALIGREKKLQHFPAQLAAVSNVYLGQTQYAVASDGRFLVNVSTDDAAVPPIAVTLDWQAALKR